MGKRLNENIGDASDIFTLWGLPLIGAGLIWLLGRHEPLIWLAPLGIVLLLAAAGAAYKLTPRALHCILWVCAAWWIVGFCAYLPIDIVFYAVPICMGLLNYARRAGGHVILPERKLPEPEPEFVEAVSDSAYTQPPEAVRTFAADQPSRELLLVEIQHRFDGTPMGFGCVSLN
jgi:hypothetical protein